MEKWEYKVLVLGGEVLKVEEEHLNKLGLEGWELVSVTVSVDHEIG